MSIRVDSISKVYSQQQALKSVNFEIGKGEIVGFLGPNGAGKSTMMKILTAYIPQSSGSAWVCDLDVSEKPLEVQRKIGYLPEHNPLYLEMYVVEYLQFMGGIHGGVSKERVNSIIEKVGLSPERHKKLGQLSKGYRQRCGLAAALLHDPEVLILDEPTTGLDPNQLVEIRNLIREIGREKTVMLSTHIMQEVEVLCNRVIIINKGEIVADQSVEELRKIQGGQRHYTVEFDGEAKAKSLAQIPGVSKVRSIGANRWDIQCPAEMDLRSAIFQFAVRHELVVLELVQKEQRLEDFFQHITEQVKKA